MKVKELIKRLLDCDPDDKVILPYNDELNDVYSMDGKVTLSYYTDDTVKDITDEINKLVLEFTHNIREYEDRIMIECIRKICGERGLDHVVELDKDNIISAISNFTYCKPLELHRPSYNIWFCPKCAQSIEDYEIDEDIHYCRYCGKRIRE